MTFAGPWATAKWTVEHDPEVDDFDPALELAWDDQYDGDGAKYRARVEMLTVVGVQLEFPSLVTTAPGSTSGSTSRIRLWPAVCEVAALLIDGQPVTHDDVLAAVERMTPSSTGDRCGASQRHRVGAVKVALLVLYVVALRVADR